MRNRASSFGTSSARSVSKSSSYVLNVIFGYPLDQKKDFHVFLVSVSACPSDPIWDASFKPTGDSSPLSATTTSFLASFSPDCDILAGAELMHVHSHTVGAFFSSTWDIAGSYLSDAASMFSHAFSSGKKDAPMAVVLGGSHGDIPNMGGARDATTHIGINDTSIPHFDPYAVFGPIVNRITNRLQLQILGAAEDRGPRWWY